MATLSANSYASPLANAAFEKISSAPEGLVSRVWNETSGWSIALTIFLLLVTYDQSE